MSEVVAVEAEREVIGLLLSDSNCLVADSLCAEHFCVDELGIAFDAISELRLSGQPVTAITVAERVQDSHGRDVLQLLGTCQMKSGATTNAKAHAAIVHRHWQGRRARKIGADLLASGDLRHAQEQIAGLDRRASTGYVTLGEAATEALSKAVAGSRGIPTGITEFDRRTGGLHPGDLVVLGARAAMGKTAFSVQCSEHIARAGAPVGFISAEMSACQIAERMMALRGAPAVSDLRSGVTVNEAALRQVAGAVNELPIYIDDRPAPTMENVEESVCTVHAQHGVRVVFVDYLQKIRGGTSESKRLEVADIAQRLKALARNLDIAVVALAQVSRNVENIPMKDEFSRMPGMADLAESTAIEAEADVVAMLYRPAAYDWDDEHVAWLNVVKNRHGSPLLLKLGWYPKVMKFDRYQRPFADRYATQGRRR